MKLFIVMFVFLATASIATATPFKYTFWDDIPEDQIRLKLYCIAGEWHRNAVANSEDARTPLSETAWEYLNSIPVPHDEATCSAGDLSIGGAFWYPQSDEIVPDEDYFNDFRYTFWDGIPEGQIRLKLYCFDGKWLYNAVARVGETQHDLSTKAWDYLGSILVPDGTCENGDSEAGVLWNPATDFITPLENFDKFFVYDEWYQIPSGKVRLKAVCKRYQNGNEWVSNAVAHLGERVPLSDKAIKYLNSITVPETCSEGEYTGYAYWTPMSDTVTLDNGDSWPPQTIAPPTKINPAISTAINIATMIGSGVIHNFSLPFLYESWEGIPEGRVRLKVVCHNSNWEMRAISHEKKQLLSQTAVDYLRSISSPAPTSSCSEGETIGSAFWFPESDVIITDS